MVRHSKKLVQRKEYPRKERERKVGFIKYRQDFYDGRRSCISKAELRERGGASERDS